MKKGILLLTLSALYVVSSCTKNYVCSCKTIISEGGLNTELPKEDNVLSNMKKKTAADSCNAMDTFYTFGNVSTTKDCELK